MRVSYIAIALWVSSCSPAQEDVTADVGTEEELEDVNDVAPQPDMRILMDANGVPDASAMDTALPDAGASQLLFRDDFDTDIDYAAGGWAARHPERSVEMAVRAGRLEVVPEPLNENHWFEEAQGPYLHRSVSGDFVVETLVQVATPNDSNPPEVGYNSAGFVIRDPAGGPGTENWIMYNIGAQSAAVPFGVEAKTTVNSNSMLELFAVEPAPYRLRVCRRGSELRYFYTSANVDDWSEIIPTNDHVRDDFPAEVQVGLVAGTWNAADVRGIFDWIVAWRPVDETSCTAPVPQ